MKTHHQSSAPIITNNNQEESQYEAQKARISKRCSRKII